MLRVAGIMLLLLASYCILIDATAMSTATVGNGASAVLASTNNATLIVEPVPNSAPLNSGLVSISNNVVYVDFRKGGGYGFELGAKYSFQDLFRIQNLDAQTKIIGVSLAGNTSMPVTITGSVDGVNWLPLAALPAIRGAQQIRIKVEIDCVTTVVNDPIIFTVTAN